MQRLPLALLASMVPLSAAAFGDMDCIAVEACEAAVCRPSSQPFAITFNWDANTVAVEFASENVEFREAELPEPSPTTLLYGGGLDDAPGILLNAEDADSILAYLTLPADMSTTDTSPLIRYTGDCSPRRAI